MISEKGNWTLNLGCPEREQSTIIVKIVAFTIHILRFGTIYLLDDTESYGDSKSTQNRKESHGSQVD